MLRAVKPQLRVIVYRCLGTEKKKEKEKEKKKKRNENASGFEPATRHVPFGSFILSSHSPPFELSRHCRDLTLSEAIVAIVRYNDCRNNRAYACDVT